MGFVRIVVACVVWGLCVLGGFAVLYIYTATPGADGAPLPRWPTGTALHRDLERPTLVMIAHAQCPCTRASMSELARLVQDAGDRASTRVVIVHDEDDELARRAMAIPGAVVHGDRDGIEARRFGAATSGQVLLYDRGGMLVFRGGITPARGHAGDSFGRRRILALLDARTPDRADSPVFGCALFDDAR
jgi:hypothetical protein